MTERCYCIINQCKKFHHSGASRSDLPASMSIEK